MQRAARSSEDAHIWKLHAFLLGEDLLDLIAFAIAIASAVLDHVGDGLASFFAGAERILVGVDEDGIGRRVDFRELRQRGLVVKGQGCACGDHRCDAAKVAAAESAADKFFLKLLVENGWHDSLFPRPGRTISSTRGQCAYWSEISRFLSWSPAGEALL